MRDHCRILCEQSEINQNANEEVLSSAREETGCAKVGFLIVNHGMMK